MAVHEPANLAQLLDGLKPKDKSPSSARILHTWIAQAQDRLGSAGPLGWLVAATVVTATLQRAVDESGTALFLLKGGTMLQYRLPARGVVWCCTVAPGIAATPYRSRSARLLFVVYGRETTRFNRHHELLTSNLIGWWTNKYGIYWQLPRTVGR